METFGSVFLVQWDGASAEERAEALRATGWEVEIESKDGGRAYDRIKAVLPDVVVVDLAKKPSHGREVGRALRGLRATRDLTIVFVDGDEQARETVRAKVTDGIFTNSAELPTLLTRWARADDRGPTS